MAGRRRRGDSVMTAHDGNVTDFPPARIVNPIQAATQRIEALPVNERRYPEMPWAICQSIMFLDVAKAACMSERRGSRQRAAGMIALAIKQLREAAVTSKAVARDDVGEAMREALGASAMRPGGIGGNSRYAVD